MCPPKYFKLQYSINPWMDTDKKIDSKKKYKQWEELYKTIKKTGAEIKLLEPQKNLPDMVFPDIGILNQNLFIPSVFRYKERKGESKHYVNWFKNRGYKIIKLKKPGYFEGQGDSIKCGKNIFFGYGFRSSLKAIKKIDKILKKENKGLKIIPIKLINNKFYHLDTCFCPLDESKAIFYPEAISQKSIKKLKKHFELFPVPAKEAENFICNSVVNKKNIIFQANNPKTSALFKKLKFKTHPLDVGEFIKAGGSCRCLSTPLD